MRLMIEKKGQLPRLHPGIDVESPHRNAESLDKNEHIELLLDGEKAFFKLIQLIESAKKYICVTTFILARDETGNEILRRLTEKAKEGVQVYLLLDAFGSFHLKKKHLAEFKRCGGRYSFFMPMFHFPFQGRANLRNHRKMVLVDGLYGMLGGMNIADEYMGRDPKQLRWKDLSILVQGAVLEDMHHVFISDWQFSSGEKIEASSEADLSRASDKLLLIPSGPDTAGDPLYIALISSIFAAKNKISIVTPYFIPNEILLESICIAVQRGVKVRIVVPKKSNHRLADMVRKGYLDQLFHAGAEIYQYEIGMVHGKLITIDDDTAFTGSANIDIRSLFLNYEIGLRITSFEIVEPLNQWVDELIQNSQKGAAPSGPIVEVLQGFTRLLSPLL